MIPPSSFANAFAIVSGGGVQSIQTGFVGTNSLTSGSGEDRAYTDVTISSVNTAKAIVCFMGGYTNDFNGIGANYGMFLVERSAGSNSNTNTCYVEARFINSTTIRLACASFGVTNAAITGRWYVVQGN